MKKSKSLALILTICSIFIIVVVGVYLILAFVFPYKLAKDVYDLGFNSYACKLYDRAYEKDNDNIDALYMALNLSIKLDYYDKTELYFEEFYQQDKYEEYIENIDKSNGEKNTDNLIKSTLLSEDNYLKNRYIKALIMQNKVEKAVEFCNGHMHTNPTVLDIGNYYYANFMIDAITNEKLNFFFQGEESIFSTMHQYCKVLSSDFKTTFVIDNIPQRVAAGNRIITVAYNLMYLNQRYDSSLLSTSETNELTQMIQETKTAINLLLME